MKPGVKRAAKWTAWGGLGLLAAGIVAPYISAQRFGEGIRAGLERALGRRVDIGAAHFDLFTGPGFEVDDVYIHEDPSIGLEPIAHVGTLEAVPRFLPLLRGRLEFASIRLDDASINLAKTGPASEPGHWNFEPLLKRASGGHWFPAIYVRNGRINFKFGDTKSMFYLNETDLDIVPPSRWSRDWGLQFSGGPARTDRPARSFGAFEVSGTWMPGPNGGKVDLSGDVTRGNIGEIMTLLNAEAGIHGTVSARLRLNGTLDNIQIAGRIRVEDVHRWDLLPPHGGGWPLNLQGRWNVFTQQLELVSSSADMNALPLSVRLRATGYLSQPHWAVAVNWNRFPIGPVMQLVRHMGVALPERLNMTGTLDGAIGYGGQGSVQGELAFHDTALTIPDSPPLRFEQARLLFENGQVHLTPALVKASDEDTARIEANYRWDNQAFDLTIATDSMHVEALRSQAALAAVPWFEQVRSGTWSGELEYQRCGGAGCPQDGWRGRVTVKNSSFPLPGLADPVQLLSANAQIHGARVQLDHIEARAGKLALEGEYRYEPGTPRPHRVRLVLPAVEAADLEAELLPVLHRSRGLLARALGIRRAPVPDWLRERHLEGTVQIASLRMADYRLDKVRARVLWDGIRLQVPDLQARVAGGTVSGKLEVGLRAVAPAYVLAARFQGVEFKSGKLDAEAEVRTTGLGADVLANLRATGTFNGRLLEIEPLPSVKTASGTFSFGWSGAGPTLALADVQLSAGGDLYTGRGATQPDGTVLFQLTSGSKEMRVTGTLAKLRVDEAAAAPQ